MVELQNNQMHPKRIMEKAQFGTIKRALLRNQIEHHLSEISIPITKEVKKSRQIFQPLWICNYHRLHQ